MKEWFIGELDTLYLPTMLMLQKELFLEVFMDMK